MSVHALCRPSPVSRSSLAWGTSRQWRRERAAFCTAASCSYGHETHAAHESSGEATTASRRAAALGLPLSVVAGAAVSAVLAPPLPAFAETAAKPAVKKQGAGDWSSPGLAVPEDESAPKFFKTPSGIRVQELARGGGKPATPGSTVLFDYIIRRSNGYFIYSTVEGVSFQPRDVPVGPVAFKLGSGALIAGLDEVLADMQEGGKRRVLIPPELGYVDGSGQQQPQPPTFATKRQLANHSKEPLLFEVQLLKVTGGK